MCVLRCWRLWKERPTPTFSLRLAQRSGTPVHLRQSSSLLVVNSPIYMVSSSSVSSATYNRAQSRVQVFCGSAVQAEVRAGRVLARVWLFCGRCRCCWPSFVLVNFYRYSSCVITVVFIVDSAVVENANVIFGEADIPRATEQRVLIKSESRLKTIKRNSLDGGYMINFALNCINRQETNVLVGLTINQNIF